MNIVSNNILIEVSKDGLRGYMTLLDNQEGNLSTSKMDVDLIINEIKNILKVGVNEDKIRELIVNECYNVKTCIAEGVLPIDEEDGYIKYNFDINKKRKPRLLEDGTVDYKELNIINNVTTGDILAEIIPPSGGKTGLKVTGEIIPFRKGRYPNIKYGKNVRLLDNGKALISEKNGHVTLIDDKIVVSDVFKVNNVDNQVGNIYFDGTVIATGNLLNDFTVKANGDVQINGLIEGGYIENAGDVIVKRGIQGYNKLVVKTKGNVTTKFIENAIIESNMNISAEVIMHSQVYCKNNINLIGRKGLIVGGVCRAGNEIKAKTVGSVMATSTVLEVGVDPEIKEKYESLLTKIEELKNNLDKIETTLKLLIRLKKTNKLDDNKRVIYDKLITTRQNVKLNLDKLTKEYEHIENYIQNASNGVIKVSDTVYPGVKIIIGNSSMTVKDELTKCTFYKEKGSIKIGPYWEWEYAN